MLVIGKILYETKLKKQIAKQQNVKKLLNRKKSYSLD